MTDSQSYAGGGGVSGLIVCIVTFISPLQTNPVLFPVFSAAVSMNLFFFSSF